MKIEVKVADPLTEKQRRKIDRHKKVGVGGYIVENDFNSIYIYGLRGFSQIPITLVHETVHLWLMKKFGVDVSVQFDKLCKWFLKNGRFGLFEILYGFA